MSTVVNQIQFVQIPNMPVFKIRQEPYKWNEVVHIVKNNELERFARLQAGSEKYLIFKRQLISDNTTIFKYLLVNQLKWANKQDIENLSDNQIQVKCKLNDLFVEPSDLKILPNDFPYNFSEGIYHLCVWTKFRIPVDPLSPVGDISKETRDIIEKYLYKTFCEKYGVKWEDLLWFKNWESLQSVKALSHVHVIIRGVSQETVNLMLYTSGEVLTRDDYRN